MNATARPKDLVIGLDHAMDVIEKLRQQSDAMREALAKCLPILESLDISKEEDDEEMPLIIEVKAALALTGQS